MKWKPDIEQIVSGVEHKTVEDAIAADLVSGLPIIGAITDFLRLIDSGTKPRRALQALDLITSPIPVLDQLTFTNTVLYLDKKGMLPIELDKINSLTEKLVPIRRKR